MAKPKKKTPTPSKTPATPDKPPESTFKQAFLGWYGLVGMTMNYVAPIKLPWAESYAKDYWRHAMGSLLIVLMLLAGAVGLALHLLDVNDFKQQIVDYVKTHKQRDLELEGDIQLNVFPSLGIDTGKMSLSQRNSGRKFASVNNARLYVTWWSLFTKQVKVERIVLDGLHANLVRHADGSTNFDDLLRPAHWMGEGRFAVDKLRVIESSLNLQDEGSGHSFFVHELNLETGHLADGSAGAVKTTLRLQSAQPQLDLQLQLTGHLLVEQEQQRYGMADLEAIVRGDALGLSNLVVDGRGALTLRPEARQIVLENFSASARGRREGDNVQARVGGTSLQREQDTWRGKGITVGGSLQREGRLLNASLELPAVDFDPKGLRSDNLQFALDLLAGETAVQGKFNSPVSYMAATDELLLPAFDGSWSVNHPLLAGKLNATSRGNLRLNWPAQETKLEFKTRIDESEIVANVQSRDLLQAPAWVFELGANTLDLDRYLVADWPARLRERTQPSSWDWLNSADIKGRLRADELRAARLKLEQLSAGVRAAAGTLHLEPLQARLYGGNAQGEFSLTAGEAPQVTVQQRLNSVQLDALLADALRGEARLSGKGNLVFDLRAQGASVGALRKSLAGSASLMLARGRVSGLNLEETLLAGREQIGLERAVHKETMRPSESTAFAELKASMELAGGHARSSDVVLKSPELGLKGEASVALEGGAVQARLLASVAPGLRRSSAGELAELSGVSIPLQIDGPWPEAALRLDLADATGPGAARLAKANQARVAAAQAPAASAPAVPAAAKAESGKVTPAKQEPAKTVKQEPAKTVAAKTPVPPPAGAKPVPAK